MKNYYSLFFYCSNALVHCSWDINSAPSASLKKKKLKTRKPYKCERERTIQTGLRTHLSLSLSLSLSHVYFFLRKKNFRLNVKKIIKEKENFAINLLKIFLLEVNFGKSTIKLHLLLISFMIVKFLEN